MVEWTDEARMAHARAVAAVVGYDIADFSAGDISALSAALDAAVNAQGLEKERREAAMEYLAVSSQAMENYARGRAEALEEAAKVADNGKAFQYRWGARPQKSPEQIAADIRALKDTTDKKL